MSRELIVEKLLLDLFDPSGLLRFIRHLPDGGSAANELSATLPPAELAHQAVLVLLRHGLMNVQFFGKLCEERPARSGEIKAVGEAWFKQPGAAGAAASSGIPPRTEARKPTSTPSPDPGGKSGDAPKATPPPPRPADTGVNGFGALVGAGLAGLGLYALSKAADGSARKDRYRKILSSADEARLRRVLRDHGHQPKMDELELVDQVVDAFELNEGLIAEAFTVEGLRSVCRTLGLPASGSKEDLATRIALDLDAAA